MDIRTARALRYSNYSEDHVHHKVRWYGIRSPQTDTLWADAASMTAFRATSGDNNWGADTDVAQLFGTGDTLSELGSSIKRGDFDEILITANSSNTMYRCRIIWGTGTYSDAITAGQYSDFVFLRPASDSNRKVMRVPTPMIGVEYKVWLQCWNATNDATMDCFVGVHAYQF